VSKSNQQKPCHSLDARLPWNFLFQIKISPLLLNSASHKGNGKNVDKFFARM
jgi:hypothetical protein